MQCDDLDLPPTADFHVHLRDGAMMELVAPMIRQGGVNIAYIMVCRNMIQALLNNCCHPSL